MDLFALPTVFLRELMKLMDVKDRLRLLHTFHGFDKLIAESNVNFCDTAGVHFEIDKFSVGFDEASFSHISYSRENFDRMLSLRSRLFNKIYVREFFVFVDNCEIPLEFIRELMVNFEIGVLQCSVGAQSELHRALAIMADFPGSKYELNLHFLPDDQQFLAIPPMEKLAIQKLRHCYFTLREQITGLGVDNISSISVELLSNLIKVHKYLYYNFNIDSMPSDGWIEILQHITSIDGGRTVKLTLEALTLTTWLRDCDITEFPKAGDVRGEFTINEMESDRLVRLSYRNCRIKIDPPLIFTRFFMSGRPVVITMSNFDILS